MPSDPGPGRLATTSWVSWRRLALCPRRARHWPGSFVGRPSQVPPPGISSSHPWRRSSPRPGGLDPRRLRGPAVSDQPSDTTIRLPAAHRRVGRPVPMTPRGPLGRGGVAGAAASAAARAKPVPTTVPPSRPAGPRSQGRPQAAAKRPERQRRSWTAGAGRLPRGRPPTRRTPAPPDTGPADTNPADTSPTTTSPTPPAPPTPARISAHRISIRRSRPPSSVARLLDLALGSQPSQLRLAALSASSRWGRRRSRRRRSLPPRP